MNKLSLKPICEDLIKKLNKNIKLISKNVKEINNEELFNNKKDSLENELEVNIEAA